MEIFIEPIEESLMSLPVLFIACLLVEYLSNKDVTNKILKYDKVGPFIGSILGCIHQCCCSKIIFNEVSYNGNFISDIYCYK